MLVRHEQNIIVWCNEHNAKLSSLVAFIQTKHSHEINEIVDKNTAFATMTINYTTFSVQFV